MLDLDASFSYATHLEAFDGVSPSNLLFRSLGERCDIHDCSPVRERVNHVFLSIQLRVLLIVES